jgi:hypothetical protein
MFGDKPIPTGSVQELIVQLLDRGYDRAVAPLVRNITTGVTSGVVAQRLAELEAEAARLAADGQRLAPDNPVLRALTADLEPVLRRAAGRLDGVAPEIQQQAGSTADTIQRQLALPGISPEQMEVMGFQWNTPSPEALDALIGYTEGSAWAEQIAYYGDGILDVINRQATVGYVAGWNPRKTARMILETTQALPQHRAQTMARTLQMTSHRDATALVQQQNAHILEEQIRIAALDDRTCLACIALHGERYPLGVRIDDHHQGRCTSVGVVKGRELNVQSGEDWFAGLSDERQLAIAGPGKYEALKRGQATLRDFVWQYDDPVFGQMVGEASLKGLALRGGGRSEPAAEPRVATGEFLADGTQRSHQGAKEGYSTARRSDYLPVAEFDAWEAGLSAAERDAIMGWAHNDYDEFRRIALVIDEQGRDIAYAGIGDETRTRYERFEEAIRRGTPYRGVSYRGIAIRDWGGTAEDWANQEYPIGSQHRWNQWASMTTDPGVALEFVQNTQLDLFLQNDIRNAPGVIFEIVSTSNSFLGGTARIRESEALLHQGVTLRVESVSQQVYTRGSEDGTEKKRMTVIQLREVLGG